MSTPRLTFLYPHLFRSLRASEPAFQNAPRCCQQRRSIRVNNRSFSTTPRRQAFIQRHGKAVEPFLKEGEDSQNVKVFTPEGNEGGSKDVKSLQGDKEQKKPDNSSSAPLSEETQAAAMLPGDPDIENISAKSVGNKEGRPKPLEQVAMDTSNPLTPLETVLRMPPPQSTEVENATKPPHLQTPPYVHHFDTYTLVQQVEAGGFTEAQAITAMKAVRGILAQNLEVAKAGLVSKSDVDNETYLFRAACSEVKTEVQNSRKKADEAMRRDRTLLTHEVDILNQKLTQELLAMKDELKGMFDDRRMSVRMEQRAMESAIQELNYKITVMLNSDSKSEVEGLRWVLTRRSVMGILFMAFMVLTSLRYASYKSHEEIENAKKKEIIKEEEKKMEEAPPQGVAEILAAN